jgi:hypothetical protein
VLLDVFRVGSPRDARAPEIFLGSLRRDTAKRLGLVWSERSVGVRPVVVGLGGGGLVGLEVNGVWREKAVSEKGVQQPPGAQTGGTGDKVRQKPSKEVDRGVGHPATRSRATAARNSRGRRDEGGREPHTSADDLRPGHGEVGRSCMKRPAMISFKM